jgi:ribonuclease T2
MLLRAIVATLFIAWLGIAPTAAQFGPGPGGKAPLSQQAPPRNEAGRFDYYALVLSWSPTWCESRNNTDREPQCNGRGGRRYSFVLHGLWPQHDKGWPENCPIQGSTFVPQPTVDRMLDIMPSRGLVIHQYRKHGTCSGLDPEGYFNASRRFFGKIKVPPRFDRPNQAFSVSPGEVVKAFVDSTPGLQADQIVVDCGGSGGRLREVRICLTKDGQFRSCGANENQRRLCNRDSLTVPPVR